jgi:hypothetical protein
LGGEAKIFTVFQLLLAEWFLAQKRLLYGFLADFGANFFLLPSG